MEVYLKKKLSFVQEINSLENKYTHKWEDIEESLGRETFSELFSHIRMIYCKSKLKQKTIEEFHKYVMPQVPDPCNLIDKVIEPLANALYDIKNCSYKNDSNYQDINNLFRWLLRNEHSEWIPPAILFLHKFRYHPDKLLNFFSDLERLSAGLMILRNTVHHRIKREHPTFWLSRNTQGDISVKISTTKL